MKKHEEELMKRWVKALRSGKYEQGCGSLKMNVKSEDGLITDKHQYCCLGVLCDISGIGEWDDTVYMIEASQDGDFDFDLKGDLEGCELARVLEHVGLDEDILVRMNDVENQDFNAIADVIEDKL